MCTAISRGQWHPWTAVSPLLGLISMAKPSVSDWGKPVYKRHFPAEASPVNRQLHTTHVGAVGWELHGSSHMTCTGKADHGFGVCVPLALIFLSKIVN